MHQLRATTEVILSLGAIETPKLLMQSGIGNAAELEQFDIPLIEKLPGVGKNLMDHPVVDCIFEYKQPEPPRASGGQALALWKSDPSLRAPDLIMAQVQLPRSSPEILSQFKPPETCWGLRVGPLQPKGRGRVSITGSSPNDPVRIQNGLLSDPADLQTAIRGLELARSFGSPSLLRAFIKREVLPAGKLDLETYVRRGALSFYHQTGTARMGRDADAVVDEHLKVRGVERLRVADGSVLPRIPRANTMAPCVVVGESIGSDQSCSRHLVRILLVLDAAHLCSERGCKSLFMNNLSPTTRLRRFFKELRS